MDALKVLLCSKTFWAGVAGICTAVGSAFGGEATWGQAAVAGLVFLQTICFRHTIAKEQVKA